MPTGRKPPTQTQTQMRIHRSIEYDSMSSQSTLCISMKNEDWPCSQAKPKLSKHWNTLHNNEPWSTRSLGPCSRWRVHHGIFKTPLTHPIPHTPVPPWPKHKMHEHAEWRRHLSPPCLRLSPVILTNDAPGDQVLGVGVGGGVRAAETERLRIITIPSRSTARQPNYPRSNLSAPELHISQTSLIRTSLIRMPHYPNTRPGSLF